MGRFGVLKHSSETQSWILTFRGYFILGLNNVNLGQKSPYMGHNHETQMAIFNCRTKILEMSWFNCLKIWLIHNLRISPKNENLSDDWPFFRTTRWRMRITPKLRPTTTIIRRRSAICVSWTRYWMIWTAHVCRPRAARWDITAVPAIVTMAVHLSMPYSTSSPTPFTSTSFIRISFSPFFSFAVYVYHYIVWLRTVYIQSVPWLDVLSVVIAFVWVPLKAIQKELWPPLSYC